MMQFELLPRPACLTAILGAQQRVAANDGTEFSAHAWLARNWPLCRPEAGDVIPCSRMLPSVSAARVDAWWASHRLRYRFPISPVVAGAFGSVITIHASQSASSQPPTRMHATAIAAAASRIKPT